MSRNQTASLGTAPRRTAVLAMLAACGLAQAGPEDERVVAGEATVARDGLNTLITASDNSIIEFQSFNIGANESVRFLQPSADARVLNRVLGASPTMIDGSLTANGRVYLVNEAGVYFGSTAVVQAGAIYAAAGTISDVDYLGGVDRFTNLGGEVANAGLIRAGEVHLAGRLVTNVGDLRSEGGLVTMTAGDEVLLGRRDGHVFVRVGSEGGGAGQVEQGGSIETAGGRVAIGAGDMFSVALRPESRIEAADVRIVSEGVGTIHVRGEIDAASSTGVGGRVAVTGEGIAVLGASIDASGATGGGEILIGGGYRGDTAVIETADRLYVDPTTTLRADAIRNGDGGLVVSWADLITVFRGSASADGGQTGGDGGLVEVSSPLTLSFAGDVSTKAPRGRMGTLLLDPERINIVGGSVQPDDALLTDNQIPLAEAPGDTVTISAIALEALGDTNILLEAANEISLAALPDGSLDFGATDGQTITINAGLRFRGDDGTAITTQGGGLVITASEEIVVGSIRTGSGDISLTAGDRIASLQLVETDGTATYRTTNAGGLAVLTGLEAGNAVLDVDRLELEANLLTASALDLNGVPTIAISGGQTGATIGAINGTDTFDVDLSGVSFEGRGLLRVVGSRVQLPAVDGLSALEVTATDELVLGGDILLDNADGGQGGHVDLREAATITLAGDTRIDTDLDGDDSAGGAIMLNGASIDAPTATLTLDASTDTEAEAGAVDLGDADLSGLDVAAGTLTLRGDLAVASSLDLTGVESVSIAEAAAIRTNGGDLSLAGLDVDGEGDLTLDLTGSGAAGVLTGPNGFGQNEALGSLTIIGDSFDIITATTTGDQTYRAATAASLVGDVNSSEGGVITFDAPLTLVDARTVTTAGGEGDDARFLQGIDGAAGDLIVQTELGRAEFAGGVTLNTLDIQGSTLLDGATVRVTDDAVFGAVPTRDRVTLIGSAADIASAAGDLVFLSNVQGPSGLRLAVDGSAAGDDIPVIRFAASVGGTTRLGFLDIDSGRTATPGVATIVVGRFDDAGDPVDGLAFGLTTAGDLTMGPFEKLTALGNLTVRVGGRATIGDIATPGNLSVRANSILIRTRAASDLAVVDRSGDEPVLRTVTDDGVDFVVGGTIRFAGPVSVTDGSLPQPTLSEPRGDAQIDGILTRASGSDAPSLADLVFNRRDDDPMSPEVTTALDARARGATTVPLASSLPAETPDRAAISVVTASLAEPRVEAGPVSAAGQGAGFRPADAAELRAEARGAAFMVDTPRSLSPDEPMRLSAGRVDPQAAERVEAAWQQLADITGQPAAASDAVYGRVRSSLRSAATAYRAATGASLRNADGFELLAAVSNADGTDGRMVAAFADLITAYRGLNLGAGETRRIERSLIEQIRPESLDSRTVAGMIEAVIESR